MIENVQAYAEDLTIACFEWLYVMRVTVECCLDCMGSSPLTLPSMASRTVGLTDKLLVWRPWPVNEFDPRQSTEVALGIGLKRNEGQGKLALMR